MSCGVESRCVCNRPLTYANKISSDRNPNSFSEASLPDSHTIECRSSLENVCTTASLLADIYINELLNQPFPDDVPRPRFASKFVKLTRELERRHEKEYDEMCKGLVVNARTVYPIFTQIADELFKNGVNWGRVLGLYAFAGALCRVCNSKGMPAIIAQIKRWIVAYIRANLATWIMDHGGWMGLDAHFKLPEDDEKKWFLKSQLKVFGLAVLTAITLYVATKE